MNWKTLCAMSALTLTILTGCSGGKPAEGGTSAKGTETGTGNTSSDAQITKAVQDKLDAEASLKAAGIKATATGGQVELKGTVKAVGDKDKAEEIAGDAIKPFGSVNAGIVNSITVEEAGEKTPDAPATK